jgi:hypothetical protein
MNGFLAAEVNERDEQKCPAVDPAAGYGADDIASARASQLASKRIALRAATVSDERGRRRYNSSEARDFHFTTQTRQKLFIRERMP